MLLKPSGGVPHVGGVVTHPGEPYYELLRAWIAAGVKLNLETPRVTKIEVHPQGPQIPLPGMKQQVIVMATYADGVVPRRDGRSLSGKQPDRLRRGRQARIGHRHAPRRSIAVGPLRRFLCRHDRRRDGGPQWFRLARSAG